MDRRDLLKLLSLGLIGFSTNKAEGKDMSPRDINTVMDMTCIVAMRSDKGVIMGGDSCGGVGTYASTFKTPKVAKVGEYLVGYTTSFRMGQLLHYALSVSKYNKEEDIMEHLVNTFIPALRKTFRDGGWLATKEGVEQGGNFILAYKDRIFEVNSDFSVLEPADNYICVGCGEDLATGALFALTNDKAKTDKEKLEIALQAATKFSAYVRPPYTFVQNYE